jgi:hypothetical protein
LPTVPSVTLSPSCGILISVGIFAPAEIEKMRIEHTIPPQCTILNSQFAV